MLRFRNTGGTGLRRSSSTSAATNSSLQICYINDEDDEDDDDADDEHLALTWDGSTYSTEKRRAADRRKPGAAATMPAPIEEKKKPDVRKPATQLFLEASRLAIGKEEEEEEEEDQKKNLLDGDSASRLGKEGGSGDEGGIRAFLAQQSKLQEEAQMALAQTLPMAKMQMELERMNRKKAPIIDIVGLQGEG